MSCHCFIHSTVVTITFLYGMVIRQKKVCVFLISNLNKKAIFLSNILLFFIYNKHVITFFRDFLFLQ